MIDFINGLGYIIEQGLDSQCLMLLAFLSTNYGSIELFKLCMCFETADCAVFDELVEDLTWKVAKWKQGIEFLPLPVHKYFTDSQICMLLIFSLLAAFFCAFFWIIQIIRQCGILRAMLLDCVLFKLCYSISKYRDWMPLKFKAHCTNCQERHKVFESRNTLS